MIYLDSSVALAYLLAEDRFPPDGLWDEQLVSSRLPGMRNLEPHQRAPPAKVAR